eukprot:CAMPEP_0115022542 /NCGR_PEP_ID=MMETSP0216-20121206/31631_1 /TAXON_ID=223996 /ORGANISM="Protocruzia adherens, Strain Boccale" /LENGTH=133 /DNA_ID=CAMNT_0002395283 /DNA_START=133 /DNA_END=531 /DNA_ORIENTATION=-
MDCLAAARVNLVDMRSKQEKANPAPIIVANHQSWYDGWYMMSSEFCPAFIARSSARKIPLFSGLADALQTLYVRRADGNDRRTVLEQAIDRQKQIHNEKKYPPLCIFAEGTTTNGTSLIKFSKGAFVAGLPVW